MRGNTILLKLAKCQVTQTGNLFQYDYGQRLVLSGVTLPGTYEVHFSNQEHGNSKTMLGDSTGVDIPDEYLLTGENIHVWVYLHDGESDGETEYHGIIGVTKRAKPTDQAPTPVQQSVIDQAIAALNAGVTEVEGIAEAMPGEIQEALAEAKASGEFDGFSPTATVSKSGDTATISITDKEGTTTAQVKDGAKGDPGDPGQDGFSPIATVTKSDDTATISITDKNGTTTATVKDGKDGTDGQDGFSPSASVSKSGTKATISITDKNGTTTAEVSDGTDGTPGQDGYSPTATVTKSGSVATISITDKNGTTTAQISDGQDGDTGATPVISIGTVSTLTPGSDATASMDTTDPAHPVLSLGIPEGEPGNATIDDTSTANNKVWSAQKVNELKSAFNTEKDNVDDIGKNGKFRTNITLVESDLKQGAYNQTTGVYGNASYRVTTKASYKLKAGEKISVTVGNGYKVVINAYNGEVDGTTTRTNIYSSDWKTENTEYTASAECWVIVNIGNTSDTSIDPNTAIANVTISVPQRISTRSELRLNVIDETLENVPTLEITFQNMFDKDTMVVGNNKAYDKTGTIEGQTVNLIDLNSYSALKIPLHGESSVSLKQTTKTGNAMLLWGWYAVDENMVITSAYGSRISQYIQNGFTLSNIPETAKYLCLSIAYYANAVAAGEYLMVVQGDTPKDYEPYVSPWYQIDELKADVIPAVQKQIDANTSHRQWIGKGWSQYGDSISTYAYDPGISGGGWANVTNKYQQFGNTYQRGIGGQSFAYGTNGGSVAFINADGSLNSVNQSYNYDNYSGSVPSGTTKSRGAFCSWLRITSMFPASMKDNVDLILVMGGTNDEANDTVPTWVENSTVDAEWAASTYYSDYGGDYNIDTLQGGVASTIMKMHAWMPNALIIIATPLNGRTGITGGKNPGTIPTEYQKSNQIIEAARMFGANVIDVFGGCGINVVNSDEYIGDGVHPNEDGRILLGNFIAGELNRILPNGMESE